MTYFSKSAFLVMAVTILISSCNASQTEDSLSDSIDSATETKSNSEEITIDTVDSATESSDTTTNGSQ